MIALTLPNGADPTPQILSATTQIWIGDLPSDAVPDGQPQTLPNSPLSLLRESRLHGERIVVYALSPVYLGDQGPTLLTNLHAIVPAAALTSLRSSLEPSNAPIVTSAPVPDPLAVGSAWTIRVSQGGLQSLSAAALLSVGLDLSSIDPSRLWLRHQGAAIPIERIPSSGIPSEIRFYAPMPGDRYNSTDTYWLTVEAAVSPTIEQRSTVYSGSVPCQSTALGRGIWRVNTFYDPRLAGPDSDHFFGSELKPSDTASPTFRSELPRTTDPTTMTLTVAGASLYDTAHTISVTLNGAQSATSWAGTAVFSRSLSFATSAGQATITLLPGNADSIHLDSISWEVPVQLTFAARGATFVGQSGQRCYSLSELPSGAALYDVSQPAAPVRLLFDAQRFEVSASAAQTYLLAGPGTLQTPAVSAHAPVNLVAPLNAQAIYIAPDAFVASLAPLVAQRQAQGYSVAVVRAQAIYDAWSGGQVRPEAIRSFLRYASETWAVKPIAVTLVGDGNIDPHDYLGYGHPSWIPPYLADVDPTLHETACENCFAQLDGDSPLDDWLPDLMIGRLPVKSAAELSQLVQKILNYENASEIGAWRGRSVFLADDNDYDGNAKPTNNFAAIADQAISELPAGVTTERVYYDPAPSTQPWRVRDSYDAFQRTMGVLDSGAATVSFLGHGLPYQWAYTGAPLSTNVPQDIRYLLNVDYAGILRNGVRLPIVLSLTCLSGQFQIQSFRGTTIDEALVLNPDGGAIATWSSTGEGVLSGHAALQRGFLHTLWSRPAGTAVHLGTLALAGYQELFTSTSCCQESLRTYNLLGDPLTPARVQAGVHEVALPMVAR
ncbi:MAG: hypothetical protein HGA65_03730 [Oscillochloris sp.]|nr:hypothetical protein [Oscillochloris sp.]